MSVFKTRLSDVRFNPSLMMDVVYDSLEQQLQGQGEFDIPDPANPFVFLLEASVLNTSMALSENEALLRRLYPSMAQNEDELYLHMSDEDYLGRFSSPAWTTFELYLAKAEVLQRAVLDPATGVRKLVIPRHTRFRVAETDFTMQYPIEIRIMSHGGMQVVYDTRAHSPLQSLENNMVEWAQVRVNRQEILLLKIPVGQFRITTHTEALNVAVGYRARYAFTDQFYYARAYLSHQGGWREIATTHTEQVFDPATPTLALKVLDQELEVTFPLIYTSSGQLNGELRVDIYTTQGQVEMDLGAYAPELFTYELIGLEDPQDYVAPLTNFSQIQVLSPHRVSGGSSALSFEELRERVLNNAAGQGHAPITHAHLRSEMYGRGYAIVTNIDNITNRQFLATRSLSAPADGATAAPAGCLMGQLQVVMADLVGSTHVQSHGERLTILPSMLYSYQHGVVKPLADNEIHQLQQGLPDAIARNVNNLRLLYSPLHYVLDATGTNFDVRPYYLDQPELLRRSFVEENNSVQITVGIASASLTRIPTGYRLELITQSGDYFKSLADEELYVQLGYIPKGEHTYTGLNGTLVGRDGDDNRIYRFDINTRFDINVEHGLYTTNLSMYDQVQVNFATDLEHDFDVTFILGTAPGYDYQAAAMDAQVQDHLLPPEFQTLTRERLRLRFGYALRNLWRRNRTLISEQSYRRYSQDVPWVYEETVFKRDETGQIVLSTDSEGNIVYEVLHAKGDTKLDADGQPIVRYPKGEVVLDAQGQPELLEPRKLLRELTLFLVDGSYYFVTDESARQYRQDLALQLVGWLENDIDLIAGRLLEQSELYLYPTATFGDATAVIRDGLRNTVALDQTFYVNYYLSDTAYSNLSLREALVASTRVQVNQLLARDTVSLSDISAHLRELAGEDVVNIEVGGLGGSANHSVVSLQDQASRLSLGKRLVVLTNHLLAVQDAIDINFYRHTVNR